MEESEYYSNEESLVVNQGKFKIYLSARDKLLGASIVNIEFVKEHMDDPTHPDFTETLLIELSNGSEIEIYFNDDGSLHIDSD